MSLKSKNLKEAGQAVLVPRTISDDHQEADCFFLKQKIEETRVESDPDRLKV
jgi:hypothetical protein